MFSYRPGESNSGIAPKVLHLSICLVDSGFAMCHKSARNVRNGKITHVGRLFWLKFAAMSWDKCDEIPPPQKKEVNFQSQPPRKKQSHCVLTQKFSDLTIPHLKYPP